MEEEVAQVNFQETEYSISVRRGESRRNNASVESQARRRLESSVERSVTRREPQSSTNLLFSVVEKVTIPSEKMYHRLTLNN